MNNLNPNLNFDILPSSYLFADISKKVTLHKINSNAKLYKLGIGDTTLPIAPIVASAIKQAATKMSNKDTVVGYGEYAGLEELRLAISNQYANQSIDVSLSEVFITDGAKNSYINICNILDYKKALIVTPVYPVYRDTTILQGKSITLLQSNINNDFLPLPCDIDDNASQAVDIIYLCSPNNPTGQAYTMPQLQQWVEYALDNNILILFDCAYCEFIVDPLIPKSIYAIKDAKQCAIEINSFSKSHGFTGLRCGYTVIPNTLKLKNKSLNSLYNRYIATNTNGVSYIVQQAALAALSTQGLQYSKKCIEQYSTTALLMFNQLKNNSIPFVGGLNAPYIWLQCPANKTSTEYFDYLLYCHNIVVTPGCGFGDNSDNYIRLSSFGSLDDAKTAIDLIIKNY